MSETTMLVAQLLGPIYLAVGLGIFLSKAHYENLYDSLKKEPLGLMFSGSGAMVIGLLIVLNHNQWGTLPEFLVSLVGWIALLKGITILALPSAFDGLVEFFKKGSWMTIGGVVAVLLGGYLSWVAYLM